MNLHATHSYGSARSPAKDPRTVEAALLSRITARLHEANRGRKIDYPTLVSALDDNRHFWSLIAIDLASEGNRLPDTLRASLISIAGFVLSHTVSVLSSEAVVDPLLDINRAVITGLSSENVMI